MAVTPTTARPAARGRAFERELREMNEALLVSSVRQHELAAQAQKAEAAAREIAGLLRAATDNASVGLVSLNLERRYKFANPAYCRILSLPADIIGKGPAELLPSVYTEQIAPQLDRAFAGQRVAYELVRAVPGRADGPFNHYSVVYEPELDGDGNITGVVVVIFDITERKRAEAVLRLSESRLRAYLTATTDAVYRMSPDWSEMLHLSGGGFIADTERPTKSWLTEYIDPNDQQHVWASISQAIEANSVFDGVDDARSRHQVCQKVFVEERNT